MNDENRSPLDAVLAVRNEVAKVVVGQEGVLTGAIAALLVNGHVLLEGVPGVAKTLLAKSLAAAFDMKFTRLQFTPDLMPSDVIGQQLVGQTSDGITFKFREGPVFTNLLLADEINRTPPKTQAALLALLRLYGGADLSPRPGVHGLKDPDAFGQDQVRDPPAGGLLDEGFRSVLGGALFFRLKFASAFKHQLLFLGNEVAQGNLGGPQGLHAVVQCCFFSLHIGADAIEAGKFFGEDCGLGAEFRHNGAKHHGTAECR